MQISHPVVVVTIPHWLIPMVIFVAIMKGNCREKIIVIQSWAN
jgi:hypothetical protein